MAKPIIKRIKPFDAAQDHEISFSWTGNRAYENRIVIYDGETNQIVFDDTISSFALTHAIPADTLINGRKYVIQAQIYDMEHTPSALSDKVLFYTFETPDFYFHQLPEHGRIANASFSASVYYHSTDNEDIGTYRFYLYDSTKKQLLESDTLADSATLSYTYRGLENNTFYYIRCVGVTVNGMELDTGYEEISVHYENPNTYARIYSDPLPSQGCVRVATNFIVIQYNGTETFEYTDGMIDLKEKTLYYDEGFLIDDDFTMILRGTNLWQSADILKMQNDSVGLTLSSHIYSDGRLRFRLLVPNGIGHYLLYSEPLTFQNTDMITLVIRKKNDLYRLDVFTQTTPADEELTQYGQETIGGE